MVASSFAENDLTFAEKKSELKQDKSSHQQTTVFRGPVDALPHIWVAFGLSSPTTFDEGSHFSMAYTCCLNSPIFSLF